MSGKSYVSLLILHVQKKKFVDFCLLARWVVCVIALAILLPACVIILRLEVSPSSHVY